MKYLVIYERSKDGYGAYIPDLPGCVAVGDTLDEVKRLIRSACKMHLDAMRRDGDPIPEPTTHSDYLELAG
jgi:predicted RNase H-like HicB family nuclease